MGEEKEPKKELEKDQFEKWRIDSLPPNAYYIPNFITIAEEELLLKNITTSPPHHWTHLSHRRLQTHPSKLTPFNKLLSSPLPNFLINPIIPRLESLHIFETSPHQVPNHVLINEYLPGKGIMPHEDGNAYYPLVATVSLGAPVVLDLYRKDNAQDEEERKREEEEEEEEEKEGLRFRVLQEERSLLVLSEEIYERFLHGIGDLRVDEELRDGEGGIVNWGLVGEKERFEKGWWERGTRVSLTYRDVRKVVRVGDALKFMGGKR